MARSSVMAALLMGSIAVLVGAMLVVGVLTPDSRGRSAPLIGMLWADRGCRDGRLGDSCSTGWIGRLFFVTVSLRHRAARSRRVLAGCLPLRPARDRHPPSIARRPAALT